MREGDGKRVGIGRRWNATKRRTSLRHPVACVSRNRRASLCCYRRIFSPSPSQGNVRVCMCISLYGALQFSYASDRTYGAIAFLTHSREATLKCAQIQTQGQKSAKTTTYVPIHAHQHEGRKSSRDRKTRRHSHTQVHTLFLHVLHWSKR